MRKNAVFIKKSILFKWSRRTIGLLLLCLSLTEFGVASSRLVGRENEAFSFDFDDTIMRTTTQIILFNKSTPGVSVGVTTGEFATIRKKIGVEGAYKDYEIRTSAEQNSFYRNEPSPYQYAIQDIDAALKLGIDYWRTEKTDFFFSLLEDPEMAERVTIVTGRGSESTEIREGLQHLLAEYQKHTGKKYYLPKLENIFTTGRAPNPSAEKANVIIKLLSEYEKKGITRWSFYDDDRKNIVAVQTKLDELKSASLWPSIEINIVHIETSIKSPSILYLQTFQPLSSAIDRAFHITLCRNAF